MANASNTVYYDTLTELDNDAKALIKHHFDPSMASKSIVVKIFSNQHPIEQLKPSNGARPVIIITAGSPGVGKSTIAKQQFRKFGIDPSMIYTISMDTLLEHNRLFRTETKKLHNKWHAIKGDFTNSNYAKFSGISTAAYAAKQANLKIPEKIANVNSKYAANLEQAGDTEVLAALHEFKIDSQPKKSRTIRTSTAKSRSPLRSPPKSPKRNILSARANSPPKNTTLRRSARLAKKPQMGGAISYHLDNIRDIGFEFGVANGLNILYDCTLTSTGKRMTSIMDVLEKYANAGGPRYEIKILLIKAAEDIDTAASIIQERIKGRHQQMVRNGFLRALTPSMGAIKSMISTNKAGFDAAYEKYGEDIVNPPYEPSDFYFEEILNPKRNM